jgi:hypothetical protein
MFIPISVFRKEEREREREREREDMRGREIDMLIKR